MEQRVLGGRYLLKDKVGTGGMATVFRAQDQVLDRTVAVKIMLPQYAGDATFAARFKQEAQAAAGLSSPYIVGVYDWTATPITSSWSTCAAPTSRAASRATAPSIPRRSRRSARRSAPHFRSHTSTRSSTATLSRKTSWCYPTATSR